MNLHPHPPAEYLCLKGYQLPQTDGYSLHVLKREDMEPVRQWRNAQMPVLRQSSPITEAMQQTYYDSHVAPLLPMEQPPQVLFCFSKEGRRIGYGGLVHISWRDLRGEVSFLVAPERAADPEVYEADFRAFLSLIRTVAFRGLGFHRIFTETYDIRERHVRILEACGFMREGRMKDHVRIDGKYVDSLLHGCVKTYDSIEG